MTENLLVSLNDIEEKEASWLVPQRMPKGQIIILAGDGGSGKTSCWCSLAAAISTGAQVFFDETPKEFFESEPQKVLFFSSEDSLEYAVERLDRQQGDTPDKTEHPVLDSQPLASELIADLKSKLQIAEADRDNFYNQKSVFQMQLDIISFVLRIADPIMLKEIYADTKVSYEKQIQEA